MLHDLVPSSHFGLKPLWKDVLRMFADDILPPWCPRWLLPYLAIFVAGACSLGAAESGVGTATGPILFRCFDHVTGSDELTPYRHRACWLDSTKRLPAVELARRGGLAVCEPHLGGNSAGAAHGQFAGKCLEACHGRHASPCSWSSRCSTTDSCRDAHVGILLESASQSSGLDGPGSIDGHSYSCPRAWTGHSDKGWKASQECCNHRSIGRDRGRALTRTELDRAYACHVEVTRAQPTHEAEPTACAEGQDCEEGRGPICRLLHLHSIWEEGPASDAHSILRRPARRKLQSDRDPWAIVLSGVDGLLAGLQGGFVHDPPSKLRGAAGKDRRDSGRHGVVLRPHRKAQRGVRGGMASDHAGRGSMQRRGLRALPPTAFEGSHRRQAADGSGFRPHTALGRGLRLRCSRHQILQAAM